jgi:superfamily II DNA/RNA helicase
MAQVHRIGRTGRAGKKGIATSFFDPSRDGNMARDIMNLLKARCQPCPSHQKKLRSPPPLLALLQDYLPQSCWTCKPLLCRSARQSHAVQQSKTTGGAAALLPVV